jgi:sialate O-acetylesterase
MVNNLQIEVTSKEVPVPVAVRYCFRNFQIGNVASTRELPLFPFRTDNW